jgi:beta-barrel assembly-enhancing protease
MKTLLRALPLFALVLVMAGCSSLSNLDFGQLAKAAQATSKASEEITPEQEYYIGRAVAATVLSMYKPWEGPKANDYINTLGQSLALSAVPPDPYNGYHFLILDSDEINAIGAPSGFILVTRGLLRCATSEDEVAAILAHEIGHVSLKHGMSAISSARKTEAALEIAKFAASSSDSTLLRNLTASFGGMVGDIVKNILTSGYSRDLEKQADMEAIRILHDVGYDANALVRVLTLMKTKLKPEGKDFAKTHPDPEVRIAYLNDAIRMQAAVPAAKPAQVKGRQTRYAAALQKI